MSFPQMKALMAIEGLWTSPAQCSVMTYLCWKDRDDLGYAAPSAREVASFAGMKRRRVLQVYEELEALEAVERLGPLHPGGRQRFVITLDRALARMARGVIPVAPPLRSGDHSPLRSGDHSPLQPGSPPPAAGCTPVPDRDQDPKYVQRGKAREAAPRLPLLGALEPTHPPAVAAAMKLAVKVRGQRLRSRVVGVARSILMNPAFAQQLVGEPINDNIGALLEATKTVCAAKRIAGYADVVQGVCVSELFKHRNPEVMAGREPRPRDLRRAR